MPDGLGTKQNIERYSVTTAGRTVPWQVSKSARNNGALKFLVRNKSFLPAGSDDIIIRTKDALLHIASCLGEAPDSFTLLEEDKYAACYKLKQPQDVQESMFVAHVNIAASLDTCNHFLWEMKYERMKDNIFPSGYTCLAKFNGKEVINHMTFPPFGQERPKDRVMHERYFVGTKEAVMTGLSIESPLFPPTEGVDREVVSLFGLVLQKLAPNKTRIIAVSERNLAEEGAIKQEAKFWIDHLNELADICHTGIIPEGALVKQRREEAAAAERRVSSCCFAFLAS